MAQYYVPEYLILFLYRKDEVNYGLFKKEIEKKSEILV